MFCAITVLVNWSWTINMSYILKGLRNISIVTIFQANDRGQEAENREATKKEVAMDWGIGGSGRE
jgi:hypothetical protein